MTKAPLQGKLSQSAREQAIPGLSVLNAVTEASLREVLLANNKAHFLPGKYYLCQPDSRVTCFCFTSVAVCIGLVVVIVIWGYLFVAFV